MTARRRRCLQALALAGALVAGACAAPPPPPEPPGAPLVALHLRHFAGTPLSGALPATLENPRRADAYRVRVRWVAVQRLPPDLLRPMGQVRRLLVDRRGSTPILPYARLTTGARAGAIDDVEAFLEELPQQAGATRRFGDQTGALPAGVTAEFAITRDLFRSDGLEPLRERLAVAVHRRDDPPGLEVAVEIDDVRSDEEGRLQAIGETVLLEPHPGQDRLRLALVLPAPMESAAARAVAVLIEVTPAPAPGDTGYAEHRVAYAECLGDLARWRAAAAATAAEGPQQTFEAPAATAGLASALAALRLPAGRRAALFALGRSTGAEACEEAALTLDERDLERLARQVSAAVDRPGAPLRGAPLGWLLEQTALSLCAREAGDGDEPPPTLVALLIRHAGGLALYPDTLLEALALADDAEQWQQVLTFENRALLEDGSPAVRVRAHAWLEARGRAPGGYDPLASSEARREALSQEAPTSGEPGLEATR